MVSVHKIIELLELEPLDLEGGLYAETYRTPSPIDSTASEKTMSAIYYLLTQETFSAFHKLHCDELFHFYMGDTVEVFTLNADGWPTRRILGTNLERGERPQLLVKRNTWQALKIHEANYGWSLLGTTCTPSFDWKEFELGRREVLVRKFPTSTDLITELTR